MVPPLARDVADVQQPDGEPEQRQAGAHGERQRVELLERGVGRGQHRAEPGRDRYEQRDPQLPRGTPDARQRRDAVARVERRFCDDTVSRGEGTVRRAEHTL